MDQGVATKRRTSPRASGTGVAGTDDGGREPRGLARAPLSLGRPDAERQRLAEDIAVRLHPWMAALGVLFALVVLGQILARDGPLQAVLQVASWLLWAVFVVEFLVRLVVAPSTGAFLRRSWWQIVLLLLPFLSFVRLLLLARLARAGRIVSSALRATRTARQSLRDRLTWLLLVHVIVVLAGAEFAYEFAGYDSFAAALHDVAYGAVVGQPLAAPGGVARVMEIMLAVYSVAVFASVAGAVGAFFLERRAEGGGDATRTRAV